MSHTHMMSRCCRVAILSLCIATQAFSQEKDKVRFEVVVDFGKDIGQDFGTLFEAVSADGRTLAGAGFADVYNTRFRSDRFSVQFFFRPSKDAEKFHIRRLPHPQLGTGVYLFDRAEKLYAFSSAFSPGTRRWDSAARKWVVARPSSLAPLRSGDQEIRLGNGVLAMHNNRVEYNGRLILAPPSRGMYYNFYYAAGHVFFFHTVRDENQKFTKIYACPWTADESAAIDIKRAVVVDSPYVGATPFAWGQRRGEVLTVCNYGGVYAFRDRKWRVLLKPDHLVSYQVYSMVNFYDRLMLAQYPTGNLIAYDGKQLTHLKNWPPVMPGVSTSAREAQSLTIYRGQLMAGVWPWAELWRYERHRSKWVSMGRMFSHPELTKKKVHPYEDESKRLKLVANHFGQRITGLTPIGDKLFIGTSSKGQGTWKPSYSFLNESQKAEYGAVAELDMNGNLVVPLRWTGRPTRLVFELTKGSMQVMQDGRRVGTLPTSDVPLEELRDSKAKWGDGLFGKLSGRMLKHTR